VSEARDASLATVLGEGVPADRVIDVELLSDAWPPQAAHVAFIRPGDRWLPGHLEAHRRALSARPDALASVGRYRRVDPGGDPIGVGGLGSEAVDVAELALRCPIEASATVLRGDAVANLRDSLLLVSRPGGDVALWCACALRGPLAGTDTPVADVLWDRERHGFDPACRIEALYTLARSPVGRNGPVAVAIRRELLARIFLEGGSAPVGFDPAALADDDRGLRGTVTDLQWTLEQQARQLANLWRGWPHSPPEDELSRLDFPSDELYELNLERGMRETERGRVEYAAQRLAVHLRERNAYIARLAAPTRRTGA
jgi:hypothetical protein